MGKFDKRSFNITNEDEALEFLDLLVAKAPQLKKILKDHTLKVQSLISRAEFAEGKKEQAAAPLDTTPAVEDSIGERLSGKVNPQVKQVAQSRIEQMRQAAASRGSRPLRSAPQEATIVPPTPVAPVAPLDEGEKEQLGAAGMAAVEASMVTADSDDPLNLPAAGEIGHLPVAPAASAPVDLAAMAAAQGDEEEIAAAAGTTPSEHAPNDGVQSQDTGAEGGQATPPLDPADTALVPPEDLVPAGDRIAQVQSQNKS